MNSNKEFATFYNSNIILFIMLLFIITYIMINWEYIYDGNYFSGEFVKPILISGILFLIFHMIMTWDDEHPSSNDHDDFQQHQIIIPKYKLGQNINNQQKQNFNKINNVNEANNVNLQNPIKQTNYLNHKYQILNKFDTQIDKTLSTDINNKLSNQNIFISQKNLSKYGVKF